MNQNNMCEAHILVNSKPVQQFEHNSNTYIEGRIGTEYSIRLKNNHGSRVMAVVTVDGINVITGQPDNDEKQGYIINGYDSTEIKGFRKDLNSVGAFKFCQKSKSYCNEKGLANNNGVIGVRFYYEETNWVFYKPFNNRIEHVPTKPIPRCDFVCSNENKSSDNKGFDIDFISKSLVNNDNSSDVNFTSVVNENNFNIGTTWGQVKQSTVTYSAFECGNLINEIIIYYASLTSLKEMGVPIKKVDKIAMPKAFNNFATPPKGWKN